MDEDAGLPPLPHAPSLPHKTLHTAKKDVETAAARRAYIIRMGGSVVHSPPAQTAPLIPTPPIPTTRAVPSAADGTLGAGDGPTDGGKGAGADGAEEGVWLTLEDGSKLRVQERRQHQYRALYVPVASRDGGDASPKGLGGEIAAA